MPGPAELLFSYGTLRQPEVQRTTFGRELEGRPDAIVGFEPGLRHHHRSARDRHQRQ
jgi:hypothetical protein